MTPKVEANEISFKFVKSLWPNQYYLNIYNRTQERVIEFNQLNSKTTFYIHLKNGELYRLESPIFSEIGNKGRFVVLPNDRGAIPFKIKKYVWDRSEKIIFHGIIYSTKIMGDGITYKTDIRGLIVTFDIAKQETSFDISDAGVIEQKATSENFLPDIDFNRFKLIHDE